MRNIVKRSFILSIMVIMFAIAVNAFAATVGEQLTSADSGWERYDDTNKNISYTGKWLPRSSGLSVWCYNGTDHLATESGSSCRFSFLGSKLRLITQKSSAFSKNITVKLDGTIYSYSAYGTSNLAMILLFENSELDYGIHTVEIISNDNSYVEVDAIDIDKDGELLPYSYTNLTATTSTTDTAITLNWDKVYGASGYKLKRSVTQGGPYETIYDGNENSFTDNNSLNPGTTYYYVVATVINGVEETQSNEASAKIDEVVTPPTPTPSTGNATLIITMTNGNIKQYNVSMVLVDDFISWYNNRASGSSGTPYFKFDKNENLAPFTKKTEYLVFDKISSFEVDEYTQ